MAFTMKGPGGSKFPSNDSDGADAPREDWQATRHAGDETFKRAIADLSTRLASRVADEQPAGDLATEEPPRRREPPRSHPFRREPSREPPRNLGQSLRLRLGGIRRGDFLANRREAEVENAGRTPRGRIVRLVLGFTLGATAAIAGLSAFHTAQQDSAVHKPASKLTAPQNKEMGKDLSAVVPPPVTAPQPPSNSDIASDRNAPQDASIATPRSTTKGDVDLGAVAKPAPSAPSSTAKPPQLADVPDAAPNTALAPYEIMEVQTRLQWLGFSPGGLDGISGRLTSSAVKRYEASKGLPQTGTIDQTLLNRLRQEQLNPNKQ